MAPMGDRRSQARSAGAWSLTRQQHGVITRQQLLALGFSTKAIKHRLDTRRLHPIDRGIYAVGRAELTREGRWMAAVLVCGDGAVLSHRSAAALWNIGTEWRGQIDVSVRRRSGAMRKGICVHRRPSLSDRDLTTYKGIPVTGPVRTVIDNATELSARAVERMINEADKRDLIDPDSLRAALDGYAGEPGVRPLRALLDRDTFRLSDTELEVRFRSIAEEAGLPPPLTKQHLNGFEVDFYWPGLGLVVETDGLRYHRTPSTQSRDALRDQTHTAAGMTTLRFTHHQVKYEPDHVRAILSRTARNLKPVSPAPHTCS